MSIGTIYAIRESCELRAFSLILGRGEQLRRLLSSLEAIVKEMERHEGRSNAALNRLDIAFHSTLVEAADEFVLRSIWKAIKHHLAIIFSLEITDGSNHADDHRQLAAALAAGDSERLAAVYRRHIAKDRLDVR